MGAISSQLHFWSRAAEGLPKTQCLKFEVAREAQSPSLCVLINKVLGTDEGQQQLSRLAPSLLEVS